MKEHLTRRGYDETTVQQQIVRAKHLRQEDALRPPTEKATNKRTPLVVSYHPNLPHLTALTKEKLPILHASNHLKQAIPELPIKAVGDVIKPVFDRLSEESLLQRCLKGSTKIEMSPYMQQCEIEALKVKVESKTVETAIGLAVINFVAAKIIAIFCTSGHTLQLFFPAT